MKNSLFKKLFMPCTIVAALFIGACNDANKPEESKDAAEEHNEAKFDADKEKDADFLVKAADINLTEIHLSQLAQTGAMSDDAKNLATMMVNDHQKALNDLNALASKKGITVPSSVSERAQKDYNDLNDKKGKDFDKEYCDKMVNGHKDAVDAFEKASTDCTDPDIRNWAASTLPTLRTHLDHAMVCQEKCKNM